MEIVFVVGTGRCGSTLLSRMIRDHPDILSVSELFSLMADVSLFGGECDGREFWHALAEPVPFIDNMVRDGLEVPEFIYPYATGRFNPVGGVPAICHMTLPMLTGDPDSLYEELANEIPSWPRRPGSEQYRRFFHWLAERRDRRVVVERTGGSLDYVAELRHAFPEARFVYLGRDGADTAMSMSRHFPCRFQAVRAEILETLSVSSPDQIGPHHRLLLRSLAPALQVLRPPFDAQLLMAHPIPPARFGERWSAMTCKGCAELAKMPADIRLALRFEDLVRDPTAQLTTLAEFLGVSAPPDWLHAAGHLVIPSTIGGSKRLDAHTEEALQRACAPGNAADVSLHGSPRP